MDVRRARGPRLRGVVTAALSTLLIAVGHVLAGGSVPDLAVLLVLFPIALLADLDAPLLVTNANGAVRSDPLVQALAAANVDACVALRAKQLGLSISQVTDALRAHWKNL